MYSWFTELSYRVSKSVQLCGMYQQFRKLDVSQEFETLLSSMNFKHDSYVAGVNLWLDPYIVLKLNYEYIKGNYISKPFNAYSLALSAQEFPDNPKYRYDSDTHFILFGTQFAF